MTTRRSPSAGQGARCLRSADPSAECPVGCCSETEHRSESQDIDASRADQPGVHTHHFSPPRS